MEATPLTIPDTDQWAEQFNESLSAQRDRLREFLAAHNARLQQAETQLSEQLNRIAVELARDRDETDQAKEELEERARQVSRETESLDALRGEIEEKRKQWDELRRSVSQQQEALAEQLRTQQEDLDRRREELSRREPQVDEAQVKLRQEQQVLDQARQEFETQKAAHWKDLEDQREALQQRDTKAQEELAAKLEEAESRAEQLKGELEATGQQSSETETLRARCTQLQDQLDSQAADANGDFSQELEQITAERDRLQGELRDAKKQLTYAEEQLAAGGDGESAVTDEDLQRRYEMAMDDVRELKAKNVELQATIDNMPEGGASDKTSPASPSTGGALDWEAEKRRILAELDSDFAEDEIDEEDATERLEIQEVVKNTDRIIAAKDQEIERKAQEIAELTQEIDGLKGLLANQSDNLGSMAVGAAALGDVLDNDAIIQEERENLRAMQEQLEEKLRKAEVDISLERAKIARERAELEETMQVLENKGLLNAASGESEESSEPTRGRWLARLGLKDKDQDDK